MDNSCIFTKNKLNFSLKNATKEFSLIRVRLTIDGVRFSYCLPAEYKIKSAFWDNEMGIAIEDPKRNPALKGNPILQTNLRNINKEIEKTTNALLAILENYRLRGVQPTAEKVKAELQKELKGICQKETLGFNDFNSFIDYYITRQIQVLTATTHIKDA